MVVVSSGFASSVVLTESDFRNMMISRSSSSSRSFVHFNPPSSSLAYVPSQLRIDSMPVGVRRSISDRGSARVNPRCEDMSEGTTGDGSPASAKSSSLSALEALKTSAGDRYTKERSSIMVIGLNFHTSPVDIREKLSIPEAQLPQAISELCSLHHIEEAAVLSTCNRMEIYVVALSQHRGVKEVTEWMSKVSGVSVSEISRHQFLLYNKDATTHLFEVSSGLDSLVLGEGQILSQVKHVVKVSQGVPGFDRKISGLFKHAITVGKRVRTETKISSGSVSVSSAAVELAQMKIPESCFDSVKVLVVGAGKMGKLVIKHLVAKGCTTIIVVNRTEDKVSAIREECKNVDIIYRPFSELISSASQSDVIFTCTASETPLFMKHEVKNLVPVKRMFIDISVPRNVESNVSDLETAVVYNVDDLKEVVEANKEDRARKASEAQSIIFQEVQDFESWKDSLETVHTIKNLRAVAERARESEFEKCMEKMGDLSRKQKLAVYNLSKGIVNRLLEGPMKHLRTNESEGICLDMMLENMRALNRIYDLETEKSILGEKIRSKMEKAKV